MPNDHHHQYPWLITGGLGYVGSHVSRALAENGVNHLILDNLASGVEGRRHADVPLVVADVSRPWDATKLLPSRLAGVIHLASIKNARESVANPVATYSSVVGGTLGALQIAGACRASIFVLSSSCSVYGNQYGVSEDSPVAPVSPYGSSKVLAEQLVRDLSAPLELTSVIFRYFNVIGAGSFQDSQDVSSGHLVPNVIEALFLGKAPALNRAALPTPDGSCIRDFIDVRDVADAHLRAIQKMNAQTAVGLTSTMNLSAGTGKSCLEVVRTLQDLWPESAPSDITWFPAVPGDPSSVYGSRALLAEKLLSWEPRFGLKESLESSVAAATRSRLRQ